MFRVLQGVAGAFIVPGSLALITATFTGEDQGRAFGIWSGASAGLTILGPFIGGLLVDTVSWRAVFLINVPRVVFTWWMIQRFVRESHDNAMLISAALFLVGAVINAVGIRAFAARVSKVGQSWKTQLRQGTTWRYGDEPSI